MTSSWKTILTHAALITTIALPGCKNKDCEEELATMQDRYTYAASELNKTQRELQRYKDAEAATKQGETTSEYKFTTKEMLVMQSALLKAFVPGAKLDPVLTTPGPNGETDYPATMGLAVRKRGDKVTCVQISIGTPEGTDNKEGMQQQYAFILELQPADESTRNEFDSLYVRQAEVSFDGQGLNGRHCLITYGRSYFASPLEMEELSSLQPLIYKLAQSAVNAGAPSGKEFVNLTTDGWAALVHEESLLYNMRRPAIRMIIPGTAK